jgi:hypothetical protein
MALVSDNNHKFKPTWQIVSFDGYDLPTAPTRDAATKGIIKFWRLFRNRDAKKESPEKKKDQLLKVSRPLLAKIVPTIDWQPGAEVLDAKLRDWLDQQNQRSFVRFFIGPPYSGHADILRLWAVMHQTPIIEPPTAEQILSRDENWLDKVSQFKKPWVFPNLERSYLRHAEGLTLIRRFLERAFSGQLGFGVVGCDSWGWSFLQKIWSVPTSDLLILKAFDGEQLTHIFREQAILSAVGPLSFRESDSGKEILSTVTPENEEALPGSPYLAKLASHSRGILGISWLGWRAGLYAEPEETKESDSNSSSRKHALPQNTIWVRDIIEEMTIPSGSSHEVAFVLHFLLLHGKLTVDILIRLLPFSQGVTTATLLQLETAGIVEMIDGAWGVSALGYPSARQFLKSNGYMVDQF